MSMSKAYSSVSGKTERYEQREQNPDGTVQESPDVVKEVDAGRFEAKQSWLNSTITQEYLQELRIKESELLDDAILKAVTYPQNQNPYTIIHNLIRVSQIRELIQNTKET